MGRVFARAKEKVPEQFRENGAPVTVTRKGKPTMVIIPFEDYERFAVLDSALETMEILEDEELMASFRESVRELAEGKGKPWKQVKKEMNL